MENINVTHDGLFTISTGSSRKTKVWKKKQVTWSKLLQRLSTTKRTNETQEQYFKLGKERQDEIKDVGGFVGGELENGRRTALTTISRQLITLDADFAEQNLWEKIITFFDNAACVYSTHKHTKENPRLRIVIPLDRPVSPDEYQAISRKVADNFGIENFDDTTYQPHRLMYFPSTSSDAEFYFQYQDGEFLSADKVLTEYDDWQDQTTWARSSRSREYVQHEVKKAQDPLTKQGLIGAFCRCYSISEVIAEYLPDVYSECGKDRYSLTRAASSGGAIVFDDKFLYSFHASDPCSLILCNAFDLVRIHKFGELDEGKEKRSVTELPSFIKMLECCSKDEKVKILITEETMADFDDLGDEKQDFKWSARLKRHPKTGAILTTRSNIRIILENDARLKNCFGYDLFSQRIAITNKLFWRNPEDPAIYWTEGDDAQIRYYLETYYGIDSKAKIEDEILSVAQNHSFHRVREYLRSLKWDGTPRMDRIFIKYLGAVDDSYTRTVTRKSLIAAVGRVMKPGLKFDNVIVLEGEQGLGKSELLSRLGGDWFSDSLLDMQGKDALEALRGYWIIEIAELDAMKKSEVAAVKKFISKKVDSFRVSYGKRTQDFPRQCIFFGTTNDKIFLKDKTGNRRFFPISTSSARREQNVFLDKNIDYEIDQVWAEAVVAWNSGESVWMGREMEESAKKIQEQHTEENPLVGIIEAYLNKKIPANWYDRDLKSRIEYMRGIGDFDEAESEKITRNKICSAEIACELLGDDLRNLTSHTVKSINDAMFALKDWTPYQNNSEKLFFGAAYGMQKAFVRNIDAEKVQEQDNKTEKKADEIDEDNFPF